MQASPSSSVKLEDVSDESGYSVKVEETHDDYGHRIEGQTTSASDRDESVMENGDPESGPAAADSFEEVALDKEIFLQHKFEEASLEIERLRDAQQYQATENEKLRVENARLRITMGDQAVAHQLQLQRGAKRFDQAMEAQAKGHACALQAQVNRRRFAEAEKEQEYRSRFFHENAHHYYRQEFYAQMQANLQLRHQMQGTSVAREQPWEPGHLTTTSGHIRPRGHARESAHPYRPVTARYPRYVID